MSDPVTVYRMSGMSHKGGHIDPREAKSILLASANEDYVGLYEAIWEFSAKFPEVSLGKKYLAAEQALRSLYSQGFIEFHRMLFSEDYRKHSYESLDAAVFDEMLCNPVSWYPDYARVRIVFTATEAGERAYCSGDGATT